MDAFYRHMNDLVESIEDCHTKGRILPCLVLLYTGIDVMASLEHIRGEGTQSSFVRWVDTYFLNGRNFPCTALDLYSARCSILHTFTPDSRLYNNGKARRIAYAWGTADANRLEMSRRKLGGHDFSSVHLRDLIDAFRNAVVNQLHDVEVHPERNKQFKKATGLWFAHMDCAIVNNYLAI